MYVYNVKDIIQAPLRGALHFNARYLLQRVARRQLLQLDIRDKPRQEKLVQHRRNTTGHE